MSTNVVNPQYFEGLEIGSSSVKWVRKNRDGDIQMGVVRHEGNPKDKIEKILKYYSDTNDANVVVTGQAAKKIIKAAYRPETECLERALSYHDLKPDILLSLGGETFTLYTMRDGEIRNIKTTSKCAAGTGEFIAQQFQRMDLTLEEGIELSCTGELVQLATRCSVFCKSDATHKLNKGECKPADIAKSLIYDIANKVQKMIELSNWPAKTIVVAGGVSLNKPFLEALREKLPEADIRVVPESPCLEAFGASLYATEGSFVNANDIFKEDGLPFEVLSPLKEAEQLLDYRVQKERNQLVPGAKYILGVDAGSTTTKAVLMNIEDYSLGASCYLRTHGNPIEATKNCLQELQKQIGNADLSIIAAASTGSGRELVSVYLDNSLCLNEILTHSRAAAEEVTDVDTVFEIGGQDSKFVSFQNGIPVDYEMNDGCSAGTGSFLEESVSVDMGIAVEEISKKAEASQQPISFGERCAAFINSDLRNALQQGATQNDVIAGLVYSIAKNYITKIVGTRMVGNTVLFQGGVALNKSVALAMAALTQKRIVVPRYPELMGAFGSCLMALDQLKKGMVKEREFNLDELSVGDINVKNTFRCQGCDNYCEIKNIEIRDKSYPFGGLCSKFENQRHKNEANAIEEGKDYVSIRNQLMFEKYGALEIEGARGTIGIPMALVTYEYLPFYTKFINELGYNVRYSEFSKEGNAKTLGEACFPTEIAHGAVHDLLHKNVDYIFLPYVQGGDVSPEYRLSSFCTSSVSIPDIIIETFRDKNVKEKVLNPRIGFAEDFKQSSIDQMCLVFKRIGISRKKIKKAFETASAHYAAFKEECLATGRQALEALDGKPIVILTGRPYVIAAPEVNIGLPRKISSKGYNVIPVDMLPLLPSRRNQRNIWYYAQQMANAVDYAKKYDTISICFVSCYSCTPDAVMYHQYRYELQGQTFCYLEMDSHTAHAGFETRIGAFLDILKQKEEFANMNISQQSYEGELCNVEQ